MNKIEGFFHLRTENRTFKRNKSQLLAEHEGEFVLIKKRSVVGTFSGEGDAFNKGFDLFGRESFLVKKILEKEPIMYVFNVSSVKA